MKISIKCPRCRHVNKVSIQTDHLDNEGDREVVGAECDNCGLDFAVMACTSLTFYTSKVDWDEAEPEPKENDR